MSSIRFLFKLDAAGALLSIVGLLVILLFVNESFRIHKSWLIFSMTYATAICLFDIMAMILIKEQLHTWMMITAASNGLFVGVTCILLTYQWSQLQSLGAVYIITEMAVITALASMQLKAIARSRKRI